MNTAGYRQVCDALRVAPEEFLLMLRALNAWDNARPERLASIRSEIAQLSEACDGLRLAQSLGLVAGASVENPQTTAMGKQICDGVKQYCNWREHSDELPRGVEPVMVKGRRVLDVGCGVGCAMLTFLRHGADRVAGIDMIESSLALCPVLAHRENVALPWLARSDGGRLPFADASFDMVFSRLALNYMRSDAALSEIARVSRPGATLVVCLNTLPWHLEQIRNQLRRFKLKAAAFGLFTLVNGALYHIVGRQITLRHRGSMHSVHSPIYHTPRTLRRDFSRWGFDTLSDDSAEFADTPTFHAVRRVDGGS